jgi:hypothetical protein
LVTSFAADLQVGRHKEARVEQRVLLRIDEVIPGGLISLSLTVKDEPTATNTAALRLLLRWC